MKTTIDNASDYLNCTLISIDVKRQEIIKHLDSIKKLNDQLQNQTDYGSEKWHVHESIDDSIHEAFCALGE